MDLDLFVVNRHLDDEKTPEVKLDEVEDANLHATQKRIAKNRKYRQKRREREREKQQIKWEIIERRLKERQFKFVQPDLNSEFIDEKLNEFARRLEEEETGITQASEEVTKETKKEVKPKKIKHKKTHNKINSGEEIEGFTVLGSEEKAVKAKVTSVLPDWLAHPTVISVDLQNLKTKVSSIKCLDKQLRNKLKEENVKYLFPVQTKVIPYLINSYNMKYCMAPRDICVSAPTGSGKTLAFVLPIIQALQNQFVKRVRALVILPTHDLAIQVYKTFRKYTVDSKLDVFLVTGGTAFQHEQVLLVQHNVAFGPASKVDILIGTAGRLVDHIKQTPGFTLEYLEFLVIDEADRVLDNVQNDWLYHLERHIYKDEPTDVTALTLRNYASRRAPQKLLFSATLSQDPEKLHQLGLFQPKLFTSIIEGEEVDQNMDISEHFVGKYTTPKELTEKYIITTMELKPLVLYQFIKNEGLSKTLVFAHSMDSAHRLKVLLQALFGAERKIEDIGKRLDNQMRNKLIQKFTDGEIDVLISTDALARGIDLPGVQCVISYSTPKFLQTYIHRAGRTARAGEQGLTVTMLHEQQFARFSGMLAQGCSTSALLPIAIDETALEPLGEMYKESLEALKETIRDEAAAKNKKDHSAKRNSRKNKKSKTAA